MFSVLFFVVVVLWGGFVCIWAHTSDPITPQAFPAILNRVIQSHDNSEDKEMTVSVALDTAGLNEHFLCPRQGTEST